MEGALQGATRGEAHMSHMKPHHWHLERGREGLERRAGPPVLATVEGCQQRGVSRFVEFLRVWTRTAWPLRRSLPKMWHRCIRGV